MSAVRKQETRPATAQTVALLTGQEAGGARGPSTDRRLTTPRSRTCRKPEFIITDFPEAEAATSLSLALALTGSFRVTTTPLLTAKDMDAGAKRMPSYRAPGT
jgi:hypothetical protein